MISAKQWLIFAEQSQIIAAMTDGGEEQAPRRKKNRAITGSRKLSTCIVAAYRADSVKIQTAILHNSSQLYCF
jgi:hypothetical protein